jgi:CubicO group peptidase (beta-lactamase class C family)
MNPSPLPRATPESQGVKSSAVLDWVNAVDETIRDFHSFMLVKNGAVIAEAWWNPYRPEYLHVLYSLSKSFTSTAVGMAVAEGAFAVEDPVISFFPDDLPDEVTPNLAAMQVRHLLAMSTGHKDDTTAALFQDKDGNWPRAFLAQPVVYPPGTHFLYNTGATYMLSAIVQKRTGQNLIDYLTPRLFEPLGITGAWWQEDPRGVNVGGFGLNVTTEDIAKLGLLYLQKGEWQGKRLLSEDWVNQAASKQTDNGSDPDSDWAQGYGYQFWRSRHNAYRGDGAFGQYCVIMPDQNAVLAITSGVADMQAPLNLVWEKLLPALGANEPIDEDTDTQAQLAARLQSLAVPVPAQAASGALSDQVSGKEFRIVQSPQIDPARHYQLDQLTLEAFRLSIAQNEARLELTSPQGKAEVPVGFGQWLLGNMNLFGESMPVASAGAWTSEDTFTVVMRPYHTPETHTYDFTFTGDGEAMLALTVRESFGPTDPYVFTAKAAD